jgi:hypothetical protein
MQRKNRERVAYVVLRDFVGPYLPHEHFAALELDVDYAKRLLADGVIAEVLPGQNPEDVFTQATQPPPADDPGPPPEPPVAPDELLPQE